MQRRYSQNQDYTSGSVELDRLQRLGPARGDTATEDRQASLRQHLAAGLHTFGWHAHAAVRHVSVRVNDHGDAGRVIVVADVPMGHHDAFLLLVACVGGQAAVAASAAARLHRVVNSNRDRIVGHRVHLHGRVLADHGLRGVVDLHVLHRRGGHLGRVRHGGHVAVGHGVQIRLVLAFRRQHSFHRLVQQNVILL